MPDHRHGERHPTSSQAKKVDARCDLAVAELAAGSEGVLSIAELHACGLTDGAMHVRTRRGHLHQVHRSVYVVGHRQLSVKGRFIAAVKACGPGATLSHLAEAARSGMLEWDECWPVDVVVPGATTRRHRGIRVHRTGWLERCDVMTRDGIRVTAPWRTVLDLAAILPERKLRRVVRQALGDGTVRIKQLTGILGRCGPRRGVRRLTRVLADAQPTRSELEDIVLDLIVAGGFAMPDVNKPLWLNGRLVVPDFRWPAQRLVVEADGRKWHDDPLARADDAARQALLEASGDRVVRVTWRQAVAHASATQKRLTDAGAPSLTPPSGT